MPNESGNTAYGHEPAEPPAPDAFVSFTIPRPRQLRSTPPVIVRYPQRSRAFVLPRPRRSQTELS